MEDSPTNQPPTSTDAWARTAAMAALVTRGCNEMQRLALSLGAHPSTLTGLSGVGDTFGTCFGPLSRNRNLGVRLGKGESLESILASSTEVRDGMEWGEPSSGRRGGTALHCTMIDRFPTSCL